MRTIFVIFAVVLTSVAAIGQKVTDIQDFGGFAGCWERRDDTKKLRITEYWMAPAGTTMLGMGRTVRDGKTTGWEFMRIEQRGNEFYFVSRPRENKEDTDFKMVSADEDSVMFENKEHDFPQRVIYNITRKKLTGRIEGTNNGKFMGLDFPMTRIRCP